METVSEVPSIKYPDWLDEEKFGHIITEILACIDRAKLFEDGRLTRVRHPLLQREIGQDVALNTEIFNMLEEMALAISSNILRDSNHGELTSRLEYVERLLMENAMDLEKMESFLLEFAQAVDELNQSNLTPEDALPIGPSLVEATLRQQLQLPTLAQDLVLYPAVTSERYEPKNVLPTLEACREDLLSKITDPVIKEEIEGIATRARAWFEANIQNSQ